MSRSTASEDQCSPSTNMSRSSFAFRMLHDAHRHPSTKTRHVCQASLCAAKAHPAQSPRNPHDNFLPRSPTHLPPLLLLRLPHHLLHNLLLLDQESSHNPVLGAVGAAAAAVCAGDGLLGTGDGGVFARTEGWDLQNIQNISICRFMEEEGGAGRGMNLRQPILSHSRRTWGACRAS